jgi:hypothetical protein
MNPMTAEQVEDLCILTSWMAENHYSAGDIAYAVEKPHKYEDELAQAKAALEEERKVETSQGVIWDNPESPEAKAAIEELHELTEHLRAEREAGYPGAGRLRLVTD